MSIIFIIYVLTCQLYPCLSNLLTVQGTHLKLCFNPPKYKELGEVQFKKVMDINYQNFNYGRCKADRR